MLGVLTTVTKHSWKSIILLPRSHCFQPSWYPRMTLLDFSVWGTVWQRDGHMLASKKTIHNPSVLKITFPKCILFIWACVRGSIWFLKDVRNTQPPELPSHSHAVNFFLQNEQGVRSSCPLFPTFFHANSFIWKNSFWPLCLYSGKLKLLFLRLFVSQNVRFQSKWWCGVKKKKKEKSTKKADQVSNV